MSDPATGDRPPVTIPDDLKPAVEAIVGRYRGAICAPIADELIELGIEPHVAANIAVHTAMTEASRIAFLSAHAFEKREPRRDWWLSAAAEHFDTTVQWYAGAPWEKGEAGEAKSDG